MANIQTTQAAGFIPEIWLATALGKLRSYLTACRTVTRDTEYNGQGAEAFQVGQTLHLPKRGTLSVNDKAEGSNYTVQNPTATKIDLTLDHHKEVTFGIESRALSFVNQDVIGGYVEDAVIAIAEQIDTDLLGYLGGLSTNAAVVGGAALTEANILSARKVLVDQKVSALQQKFGVVATSQTNALLQIDRLVRYDALGVSNDIANAMVGSGVRTMEASIGKVHGFELCESQLLVLATTYKNCFYSKDAILFAMRPLEIPDPKYGVYATTMTDPESGLTMRLLHGYNISAGAHQITLDVLYGFVAQRPEHVQVVTTTA